jgi:hypothetical protein
MLKVFAFTLVMVTCIGVTSVGYADTEPAPPPPPSAAPAKVWAYTLPDTAGPLTRSMAAGL